MEITDSIIQGMLQGFTEFLPVSSSGHLTIYQHLSGNSNIPLLFDIFLHLASLVAVIFFFRKKLLALIESLFKKDKKEERKEILFIFISTFITAILLPLTKPVVLYLKEEPKFLLFSFIFTGIILIMADKLLKSGIFRTTLTLKDAIIIGLLQGIAVFPGISRSGSTIFAGLFSGLKGEKAVEYSFLLAIPAILGAVVLEIRHIDALKSISTGTILAGCISSFIISLLSLNFLVYLIKRTNLRPFSYYLFALSIAVIFLFWF